MYKKIIQNQYLCPHEIYKQLIQRSSFITARKSLLIFRTPGLFRSGESATLDGFLYVRRVR